MQVRSALLVGIFAGLGFVWACSGLAPSGQDAGGGVPAVDAGSGSDGGNGQTDGGVAGLPLASACETLTTHRCEYLQRCGLVAPGADALSDCAKVLSATSCSPTGWPARVKAGTLSYDGMKAQACADAWTTRDCGSYETQPSACQQIVSPAAVMGGKCFGGPQTECSSGVCTGGTCPRQCRARGSEGELCEVDGDCKSALYCQLTSSAAIGTCAPYSPSGESCDYNRRCEEGTFCNTFKVCQPLAKTGEPCGAGACELAAFCTWGPDGGVCAPRLKEGDACGADAECEATLLCLAETGRCASAGPVGAGEACSRRQSCEKGTQCVGTGGASAPELGTCITPYTEGVSCTASLDCADPLACALDVDGGTCLPRRADGDACVQDGDCRMFSRCHKGVCEPLPLEGDSCASGMCLYGSCEALPDAGLTCIGLGGPNAPCQQDAQCASSRCVSGACLAACTP